MKINEAEQLLGITKANIRFYEKENLITPARTENGYRDYTDSDILRLKQIIILRKLGIPVNQIEDILDGIIPLQNALDNNILSLQQEIDKLNGSLSLCCQLKREAAPELDTERYWELIHQKEQAGFLFQSLIHDCIQFTDNHIRESLFIPEYLKPSKSLIVKRVLLIALSLGLLAAVAGVSFWHRFSFTLFRYLILPFLLAVLLIPAFLIGKKNEKYGKVADILLRIAIAVVVLYFWMKNTFT